MTKKFKKILFISTLLGFLIFAPILLFYSQGYRFDFNNKRIVQTGGLFFNVSPNGSKISIDEKISRKTSFIFGSSFISGLMPKKYEIKIEKENYHPWQKTLEVEEKKVTECKDIQLFLKNPEFSLLSSGISDIFIAPNEKELIIKKQDENGWRLELFDLGTQESIVLVKEEEFIKKLEIKSDAKPLLQFAEFSNDSKKVLLKIIIDAEDKYFLIDLLSSQELIFINTGGKIKNISFEPNNGKELFLIGSNIEKDNGKKEIEYYDDALFSFNPNREEVLQYIELPVLSQKIMSYAISNGNIIWMDGAGFLYKGQIKEGKVELLEILSLKPLLIHEQSNYKIIVNNLSQIFIKEDETLYFLDPEAHMLTRVFASLKKYQFSPDNKKIALRNEHEIVIIFLEEQTEQPQRKKREKFRLIGISEKLDNLFWLNNHYLIFRADNAIKIIEIDDRDNPNLIELKTFSEPKIAWLEKQKSLLILSDNALYLTKDILK
ncbi:PEGA domain-containing protein [Patescibacteria group bacterium]|nr:PEGA domain-containing protein [Patescibacteria group bacterium]